MFATTVYKLSSIYYLLASTNEDKDTLIMYGSVLHLSYIA